MKAARPNTLRWFEYALIASQFVNIANTIAHWNLISAAFDLDKRQVITNPFINASITIGLGIAVSRGKLGFARWFLLFIISVDVLRLAAIPELATKIGIQFTISLTLGTTLMFAAAILMFLPASNDWLNRDKAG